VRLADMVEAAKRNTETIDERLVARIQSMSEVLTRAATEAESIWSARGAAVANAIRAKVVRPETDIVSELAAKGEIELGMVVITQIRTTPGVDLVGPIPQEVQSYVRWSGGVSTNSTVQQTAKELIQFLTGPLAVPVLKAQGMEPG